MTATRRLSLLLLLSSALMSGCAGLPDAGRTVGPEGVAAAAAGHGLAWNVARLALSERTLRATVSEGTVTTASVPVMTDPGNPPAGVDRTAPSLADRFLGRGLAVPQFLIVTPADAGSPEGTPACSASAERFAAGLVAAVERTAETQGLRVPGRDWGRWREKLHVYLHVARRGGPQKELETLEWSLVMPCGASALPVLTREALLERVPGIDRQGLPAGDRFTVIGMTVGAGTDEEREEGVTRDFRYGFTGEGRQQAEFLSDFLPALARNLPEGVFMIVPPVLQAERTAGVMAAVPYVAAKGSLIPFVRNVPVETR